MTSSSTRAFGLLTLLAISWPALSEARPPQAAGHPAAGVHATGGGSSAQLRVGLVLVSADGPQTAPPSPSELDYPASPSAVMCRSDTADYRECRTPFRGRVVLSRELDGTTCVEGRDWGWSEGAVWVDRGCAAVFLRESAGIAGSRV